MRKFKTNYMILLTIIGILLIVSCGKKVPSPGFLECSSGMPEYEGPLQVNVSQDIINDFQCTANDKKLDTKLIKLLDSTTNTFLDKVAAYDVAVLMPVLQSSLYSLNLQAGSSLKHPLDFSLRSAPLTVNQP